MRACIEIGISYLTLFAFSSENWKRPKDEVQTLMGLLRSYLESEIEDLVKNGVRLKVIGCREDLDQDIQKLILSAEKRTMKNKGLHLTVALNYGGRKEILLAVRAMVRDILKGDLKPDSVSEEKFEQCLETHGIPDPDLLIRTGGEQRISNFLLWQSAYTELFLTDIFWPDFREDSLFKAIIDYQTRQRRYGMTGEQISP